MLYERGVSEGLFFLLKTEAKRHKSGQTEQNKGEKSRDICTSFTAVTAYTAWTLMDGSFILLFLFTPSVTQSSWFGRGLV